MEERQSEMILEDLKNQADLLGLKYHPNIKAEKLSARIQEKLSKDPEALPDREVPQSQGLVTPQVSKPSGRQMVMQKALKLHRIKVTCMNDKKSKMEGEIFSAGNAAIGFVKKYVPFNAENGWHVPYIILKKIEDAKYVVHYEVTINGKKVNKHKLVPEFAIEYMKPLTPEELNDLRQRQLINSNGE